MIALTVFEKSEKKEEVKPLALRLIADAAGVNLVAVDTDGNALPMGYLLRIDNAGFLVLNSTISKKFGLPLDSIGRLLTVRNKSYLER